MFLSFVLWTISFLSWINGIFESNIWRYFEAIWHQLDSKLANVSQLNRVMYLSLNWSLDELATRRSVAFAVSLVVYWFTLILHKQLTVLLHVQHILFENWSVFTGRCSNNFEFYYTTCCKVFKGCIIVISNQFLLKIIEIITINCMYFFQFSRLAVISWIWNIPVNIGNCGVA